MIPIVIGTLGTVIKALVQGLGDLEMTVRVETVKNYSIVEIGQYTEESPVDEETCCLSNSSGKPSGIVNAKNSNEYNNNDK